MREIIILSLTSVVEILWICRQIYLITEWIYTVLFQKKN